MKIMVVDDEKDMKLLFEQKLMRNYLLNQNGLYRIKWHRKS